MNPKTKKGFTLVELLIVIAVLAILIASVVIVLNPGEILAQARDSQRLSDIRSLTSAMQLYIVQPPAGGIDLGSCPTGGRCTFDPGTGNGPFTGDCDSASGTVRTVDGKGWMDVNLTAMSTGSPIPTLPIDPTNNATYFYGYYCNKSVNTFEFASRLESVKYRDKMKTDAGVNSTCSTYTETTCFYETGTSLLPPPAIPSGLSYTSPNTFLVGSSVTLLPTVTGTVTSYSVLPSLPSGLSLNTSNGQITGTPTATSTTATYTVTASNISGSTTFGISITVVAPVIGASYGGGKIAYILQPGDPGYVAGETHGLIVATADQSSGMQWYNGSNITTGATATALGTGLANTNTIIAVQGAVSTSYAAGLARSYTGGGYSDWYLPSKDELNKIYLNKTTIGGISTGYYWSSSESSIASARMQRFYDGTQGTGAKYETIQRVRAVRSF